jgi:hypothetical protein
MRKNLLIVAAAVALAVGLCQSSEAAIFGNRRHNAPRQHVVFAQPFVFVAPTQAVVAPTFVSPTYGQPAALVAPAVVAPGCNQFFVK